MKQPKIRKLKIDKAATKRMREEMSKTKKVKITVNPHATPTLGAKRTLPLAKSGT